jgi:Fe-S cluster assembly iron-binding protein IscA
MQTMEKRRYNKPEVKNTKIDFSITLTGSSQDPVNPNDPNCTTCPPPFPQFMNPLKWFK